jgi:hypothetical protein
MASPFGIFHSIGPVPPTFFAPETGSVLEVATPAGPKVLAYGMRTGSAEKLAKVLNAASDRSGAATPYVAVPYDADKHRAGFVRAAEDIAVGVLLMDETPFALVASSAELAAAFRLLDGINDKAAAINEAVLGQLPFASPLGMGPAALLADIIKRVGDAAIGRAGAEPGDATLTHRYLAKDGSEWPTEKDAARRDKLSDACATIERKIARPTEAQAEAMRGGRGYYQHVREHVRDARGLAISLVCMVHVGETAAIVERRPAEVFDVKKPLADHPFNNLVFTNAESLTESPLGRLWQRLTLIDGEGREWDNYVNVLSQNPQAAPVNDVVVAPEPAQPEPSDGGERAEVV